MAFFSLFIIGSINLVFNDLNSSDLLNTIKFIKFGTIKTVKHFKINPNIPSNIKSHISIVTITSIIHIKILKNNFLKYLSTFVLNSYLCINYGSIQVYETSCAKHVPQNIPDTPIRLHKIIEKTILVIAPIYGADFPFENNPIVTLYV